MGRKYLFLTCAVSVLLAALTGCITPGITPVQSPPAESETVESQTLSTSEPGFPDFSRLVELVGPSVVAVEAEKLSLDDSEEMITQVELGSGWVLDEETIVTNSHVIDGSVTVRIEFFDHREYRVDSVYADPVTDLAVLKVKLKEKLNPLPVAETSNLRVGNWVLAMGNPVGKGISAKTGIVSRLGVTMSPEKGQVYGNLIETSAPLNRGNSGGPLINMQGEVVGINTLKIDESGVEGMGYAINIEDAMPIIKLLSSGQQVPRAWLGIDISTFDENLSSPVAPGVSKGAIVTSVSRNSPASHAGIDAGDIITRFNGKIITSAEDLIGLFNLSLPGQTVKITFWQGKTEKTTEITLEYYPTPDSSPTPSVTPR